MDLLMLFCFWCFNESLRLSILYNFKQKHTWIARSIVLELNILSN